jgi:hypothetical protein
MFWTRRKSATLAKCAAELVVCELKPTVIQPTLCKTRDEFDNFVAAYMDE